MKIKTLYRSLFLFLIIFSCRPLFAQKVIGRFEYLTIEQGLSQSSVRCIIQDRQGFLWFGTESGLNRYDGYRFIVFKQNPDNRKSISNNMINDLALDTKGGFWIATENGLNVYNPDRASFRRYYYQKKEGCNIFKSLLVDSSGLVWVGSANGLLEFNPITEKFSKHTLWSRKQHIDIYRIIETNNGFLWLATSRGLYRYNKISAQFRRISPTEGRFRRLVVYSVCQDARGWLWLASKRGLARFNPKGKKIEFIRMNSPKLNSAADINARVVFTDRSGLVWIGYGGEGLAFYDPQKNTFSHFNAQMPQGSGTNSNFIRSIYEDSEGILWFGSEDDGVNKLIKNSRGFDHYKITNFPKNKNNANMVMSFAEDKQGLVWLGTFDGLYRFNPQKRQFRRFPFPNKKTKAFTKVFKVLIDSSQRIWAATKRKGLYYLNPGAASLIRYSGKINKDKYFKTAALYDLVEDQPHRFWLATSKGLFHLDVKSGNFTHYLRDPADSVSLGANLVRVLYLDRKGLLWLGTIGGGLERLDEDKTHFIKYLNKPEDPASISNNQIMAINQDADGMLWIGTNGSGLNRFDPATGKFAHLSAHNPLSTEVIYGILFDNRQRLWASTVRGLYLYSSKSKMSIHYGVVDGLQSFEFNLGAAYKMRSGAMLFGGINGFNFFYPERIRRNKRPPKIQITDFKIFDKSIGLNINEKFSPLEARLKEKNRIVLEADQNTFSFDFAALAFKAPRQNFYIYRLKGLEKHWHLLHTRKTATYINVSPGQYVFEVKGSNCDNIWNLKPARFAVFVKSPFYATFWFRSLLIGLLFLILYCLYKLRVHYIKKRNTELQKINRRLNLEIKERKKIQQALNESERKLTTLIKNLPGIAYRSSSDSKRKMSFVSEGALALSGYRPEIFTSKSGLPYIDLIHPDDKEGVLQEIQEKLYKKTPFQLIYRLITSTNQIRWVWEQGRGIYNNQGTCEAIEGFIIDISERKQLEEQLVQAQKMEAVGQLAGGIAHDFNNLLTVIRGYSELSLALLEKESPVYQKVEQINRAVERASALTQQLLAFSRKQVLKPVVLHLNKQIQETEKMLRRLIGENIRLITRLEATPDTIKADPGKVEQIILNLAINARDAMPEGGQLTISTTNVILDDDFSGFNPELKAGKYLMLSVSDSGTGMDEETKNHVFDPFFTTKKNGKGTGLGLATVYGIAMQSKGHITVTSQPGAGTTFMIYFPKVADEIIASKGVEKNTTNIKGSETILVVEDKNDVREVITESLQQLGYTVFSAENGLEALKLFSKEAGNIDLLLTDVIMPELNGKELSVKLKAQKESLPVIFMSGYTDNTLGEEDELSPDTHFIQKPFTTLALAHKIRQALD